MPAPCSRLKISRSLGIRFAGVKYPHPLSAFSFNHRYTEEQIVDADRDISIFLILIGWQRDPHTSRTRWSQTLGLLHHQQMYLLWLCWGPNSQTQTISKETSTTTRKVGVMASHNDSPPTIGGSSYAQRHPHPHKNITKGFPVFFVSMGCIQCQ